MIIQNREELNQFQNKFIVYMLTSPNGKQYCGYSSNIKNRQSRNGNEYERNTSIYKAIKKYGQENMRKEILFVFDNKEEALLKEKEVIEQYDLLNPDKGYNLVPGGGDPPHGKQFITPEGLEKMKENGKRLAQEVWSNPEKAEYAKQRMKEEVHKSRMARTKEERKEIQGKHNIGRIPPNAKPIYQLDKDTLEILNEYPSATEAARALNQAISTSSNIRFAANGKRPTAYGYRQKWKEGTP